MKFDYLTLENLFYDAVNFLVAQGDGEDYFAPYAKLKTHNQVQFLLAFENLDDYCNKVKAVNPSDTVTSQLNDTAMLFYVKRSPRPFMVAYTVKPEYVRYGQTFATCCKYFCVEDVLAVFNAYFDYLETKRE